MWRRGLCGGMVCVGFWSVWGCSLCDLCGGVVCVGGVVCGVCVEVWSVWGCSLCGPCGAVVCVEVWSVWGCGLCEGVFCMGVWLLWTWYIILDTLAHVLGTSGHIEGSDLSPVCHRVDDLISVLVVDRADHLRRVTDRSYCVCSVRIPKLKHAHSSNL